MRIALIGAVFFSSVAHTWAADTIFAVVSDGNAVNPFLARHDGRRFGADVIVSASAESKELDALLRAWRRCARAMAVDVHGMTVPGRVVRADKPGGGLGSTLLRFKFDTSESLRRPLLAWCGEAAPTILRTHPVARTRFNPNDVRKSAQDLVATFVSASSSRSGESWTLGTTKTLQVAGAKTLIANTSIHIGSWDKRAYVFQVVDMRTGMILWQAFGHPEWASSEVGIKEVSSDLFFRLPGSVDVLMLGRSGRGWESTAHGIYRLRTGDQITESQQ